MKATQAMQVLFAHALVLFHSAGEKSGKLIGAEMEKFQHVGGDKMPSHFSSLDEYLMARESEVGISSVLLLVLFTPRWDLLTFNQSLGDHNVLWH